MKKIFFAVSLITFAWVVQVSSNDEPNLKKWRLAADKVIINNDRDSQLFHALPPKSDSISYRVFDDKGIGREQQVFLFILDGKYAVAALMSDAHVSKEAKEKGVDPSEVEYIVADKPVIFEHKGCLKKYKETSDGTEHTEFDSRKFKTLLDGKPPPWDKWFPKTKP